jgi:hypothetical protein
VPFEQVAGGDGPGGEVLEHPAAVGGGQRGERAGHAATSSARWPSADIAIPSRGATSAANIRSWSCCWLGGQPQGVHRDREPAQAEQVAVVRDLPRDLLEVADDVDPLAHGLLEGRCEVERGGVHAGGRVVGGEPAVRGQQLGELVVPGAGQRDGLLVRGRDVDV